MTPEEGERQIKLIFPMLDADLQGEREAALQKVHDVAEKIGRRTLFGDLLRLVDGACPLVQFQAVQSERDALKQANATLTQANAALVKQASRLRAALWMALNLRRIGVIGGAVIALGYGGYRLGPVAFAAAVEALTPDATPKPPTFDDAMRALLSRTQWGSGDTKPQVHTLAGSEWWVLVKGDLDVGTLSDAQGRPIERQCLHLYAEKAVSEAGAYITPQPYGVFGSIKWSLRASECRMPGTKTARKSDQ